METAFGSLLIAGKRTPFSLLRHLELLSGDGLSRIEVDTSGLVHGESPGLHYGCADVADCFHRMRLFGEIRHSFWWPGVSNKYLKMTEVEGTKVSSNQIPCRCGARHQCVSPGVSTLPSPQIGHD